MPAGVSWARYSLFFAAAMITMLAGAQTIHVYYNPLRDMDKFIEKELEKKLNNMEKYVEDEVDKKVKGVR